MKRKLEYTESDEITTLKAENVQKRKTWFITE